MFYASLFAAMLVFGFLAGILNRREGRYPLVKRYGKDYRIYGGEYKGVRYIETAHCMMLDWDVPNEGHKSTECLTISRKEEALDILNTYCMEDKSMLFRVYETPGGVRAFVVSRCYDGIDKEFMKSLKCDPLYIQFSVQRRVWACRVSPKVGRKGDYVARYWTTIGDGKEDEGAMELVKYHDELIAGRSTE